MKLAVLCLLSGWGDSVSQRSACLLANSVKPQRFFPSDGSASLRSTLETTTGLWRSASFDCLASYSSQHLIHRRWKAVATRAARRRLPSAVASSRRVTAGVFTFDVGFASSAVVTLHKSRQKEGNSFFFCVRCATRNKRYQTHVHHFDSHGDCIP